MQRTIVVSEFVTLDGVMEDPGGSEHTPFGGWAFRFERGSEGDRFKLDELMAADALLLGRKTYDGFAAAWPSIEDEHGFAERMNGLPKYVVSSTLADPTWNATAIGLEEIETPSDFTLVSAVPSEQVVLVTLAKH